MGQGAPTGSGWDWETGSPGPLAQEVLSWVGSGSLTVTKVGTCPEQNSCKGHGLHIWGPLSSCRAALWPPFVSFLLLGLSLVDQLSGDLCAIKPTLLVDVSGVDCLKHWSLGPFPSVPQIPRATSSSSPGDCSYVSVALLVPA